MPKSRFSIPAAMTLLAAGTLSLGAPTPAGAAEYGPFPLKDVSQIASWSGEVPVTQVGLPEACTPDVCDIVEVNVELPEGTWDPPGGQPGGMLVATHPRGWGAAEDWSAVNNFDLYVYYGRGPERIEVARANSLWSGGDHAAWVKNPPNGDYTVVVVMENPGPGEPPARYDGLVSFDRGLTVKREGELRDGQDYTHQFVAFGLASAPSPPVKLLPDLVPTPAANFHMETGVCFNFSLCIPRPAHQPSCYPEETAGGTSHAVPPEPGPTRCLRFSQGENNVGDGPLEVHIYPSKGTEVYQRIYRSDGSVIHEPVGEAEFHPSHAHFHYKPGTDGAWWDIKMYKRLPNGEPDLRDEGLVASFRDKGICPLDIVNGRFGQRGAGPQGYGDDDQSTCGTPRYLDPNDPTFPDAPAPYIKAGISVGWTDFYPYFVKDMYFDITDVADGKYIIVTRQDPVGALIEKTTANNTAMACVEIGGMGTTARACPPEPDLQVTSLSTSNTKGREGEKVVITATVSNTGEADAAPSSTEFLLDGAPTLGGPLDTPALGPGESVSLSLNWDTRGVKGEHTITAIADSPSAVEESNEDNNTREITVSVRGNKIQNPSFEESSNGNSPNSWSSSGESGYESGGSDGSRSVSTGPGGSWTSEAVPIEAGSSYEVSAAASGAGGTLLVQQLTADGSVLSSAAQALLPSEVFTLTSLDLTALPGAAEARVVLVGGLTGRTTFDDIGLWSS